MVHYFNDPIVVNRKIRISEGSRYPKLEKPVKIVFILITLYERSHPVIMGWFLERTEAAMRS